MTKIDIISGFLGAGKTTLIKKLLSDQRRTARSRLLKMQKWIMRMN